jgi:hypothetical protein
LPAMGQEVDRVDVGLTEDANGKPAMVVPFKNLPRFVVGQDVAGSLVVFHKGLLDWLADGVDIGPDVSDPKDHSMDPPESKVPLLVLCSMPLDTGMNHTVERLWRPGGINSAEL